MSNTLEKLFITEVTLVPGYTTPRWNPAVTTVTSNFYIWAGGVYTPLTYLGNADDIWYGVFQDHTQVRDGDIWAVTTYGLYIPPPISWPEAVNPASLYYTYVVTTPQLEQWYTIHQGASTTVTTPGYISYDVVADTYTTNYNPNNGWNASARSIDSILGDGTASFQPRVDATGIVVGLNEVYDSLGSDYFEITYGIYFSRGYFRILEQGIPKTALLAFTTSDIFTISRTNNDVFYAINGNVFYKSTSESVNELLLDCSLYAGGDAVFNASIIPVSDIFAGFANCYAVGAMYAVPKATADPIVARSTLGFNGNYSIDDTVYSTASITASGVLTNNKTFGQSVSFTATTVLTATSHQLAGMTGALGSLTASLTSGYQNYAEIKAGLQPLTLQAGDSGLTPGFTYIAAAFPGMTGNVHCLSGGTNVAHTVSLSSMTCLLADHAYAAIQGSFTPLVVRSGQVVPFVINVIPFISSSIEATGYLEDTTGTSFSFITSTLESYGGAVAHLATPTLGLDSTGTHIPLGSANIAFTTFTLSSTGIGFGAAEASLGFFSSTITSFGGANALLSTPTFSTDSTGYLLPVGAAELGFLNWSVTSQGTLDASGTATIGFPTFSLVWGGAVIPAPLLALSAQGSVPLTNAVAYVLNLVTKESTRYTNYAFEHVILLGNKPYGVTPTGLYLLEGATDNGTLVDGYIVTKETDMGTNMAKSIPFIYLNSDTETITTAYMDGVAQAPRSSSFSGRKCHLSRGAEARYIKLKIAGIKTLQSLEILPEMRSRRVK